MEYEIVDTYLELDSRYPDVERKLPTAKDKGWTKVGGFLLRDKVDFIPQPGLQENVCCCEANVIYMTGAATGGKTFAGILCELYRVDKKGSSGAMISFRLQDSKKGGSIFRDNELVLGAFAECQYNASDYPTFAWPVWGSVWRLIHSNYNTDNPTERSAFIEYAKKNQNGYQYFDEANDLPEFQYHYWNSRNRDDSGVIPQSIYSFNPPEDENHYFTRNMRNGGYIGEDWCFKPEMNGKIRYYFSPTDNIDDTIWGDTAEEVAKAANIKLSAKDIAAGLTEVDMIRTIAVFYSDAADNRMLISSTGGKSVANLLYSGQGDSLKWGYFGPREKNKANVTKQMLHSLWQNPVNDDENMYATLDVSGGSLESDNAPMLIWKGLQLIDIKFFRGNPKELVDWIDKILKQYNIPIDHFAYDATGIGYYLRAYTAGRPITANKRCLQEYDEHGNQVQLDEYFNLRSQLLGKTEVMLKKGELSFGVNKDLVIPYGKNNATRRLFDVLCNEMNVFITTTRNKKTYYRSKDEYKSKFKSSPDLMDAISYRAIFELDTRERKQPKPQVQEDAYNALYQRQPIGWGSRYSRY